VHNGWIRLSLEHRLAIQLSTKGATLIGYHPWCVQTFLSNSTSLQTTIRLPYGKTVFKRDHIVINISKLFLTIGAADISLLSYCISDDFQGVTWHIQAWRDPFNTSRQACNTGHDYSTANTMLCVRDELPRSSYMISLVNDMTKTREHCNRTNNTALVTYQCSCQMGSLC